MIEEILLQYGALGVLVIVLYDLNRRTMKQLESRESKLSQVVEDNTKVMTKFIILMEKNMESD